MRPRASGPEGPAPAGKGEPLVRVLLSTPLQALDLPQFLETVKVTSGQVSGEGCPWLVGEDEGFKEQL